MSNHSDHSDHPNHHHHTHCCDKDHSPTYESSGGSAGSSPWGLLLVVIVGALLVYGYFALKSWYLARTGIDISF